MSFACGFFQRQDTGHFTNDVNKLGTLRNDNLRILAKGFFNHFQFSKYLCVADEIFISRVVDEPDCLGLTLGPENIRLLYTFGLFNLVRF